MQPLPDIRSDPHYGGEVTLRADAVTRMEDASVIGLNDPYLTWKAYGGGMVEIALTWPELMRLEAHAHALINAYRRAGGQDEFDD